MLDDFEIVIEYENHIEEDLRGSLADIEAHHNWSEPEVLPPGSTFTLLEAAEYLTPTPNASFATSAVKRGLRIAASFPQLSLPEEGPGSVA